MSLVFGGRTEMQEDKTMAQDDAAVAAKGDDDARLLYQVAAQLWAHSEQIRWSLLYDYLMASTILLLAWATVFASPLAHGTARAIILVLLAAGGTLISFVWTAFVLRDSTFVDMFENVGVQAEGALTYYRGQASPPLRGPFVSNRAHRDKVPTVLRWATSRRVVLLVCGAFTLIYAALTILSSTWL
jgi:hypothetical protein